MRHLTASLIAASLIAACNPALEPPDSSGLWRGATTLNGQPWRDVKLFVDDETGRLEGTFELVVYREDGTPFGTEHFGRIEPVPRGSARFSVIGETLHAGEQMILEGRFEHMNTETQAGRFSGKLYYSLGNGEVRVGTFALERKTPSRP
ncbi:hypothetical protein HNR42_002687 [Deinobacterium chartae]|uniref:Uncharacterized protein n=1 Tax=Deinobacterium chartae TaxID=521158 RepID=A0A841I4M8_9DEIO|nr:hypothetical protein [Deinobacterium chartae]MBB6099249.1 hypothetical protein [Deinobacterium chartae]